MCGRFTLTVTIEQLMERFLFEDVPFDYSPRYNAAPGQWIPAIIAQDGKNRIGPLRWGLVPSWAKDEKIASHTINARVETIMQKPAFRTAFERRRCLIPADGYYEWKTLPDGKKQPVRIRLKDEGVFALAGLYEIWTSPDGKKLSTCTIVTTQADGWLKEIHPRMPVILRREDEAVWLDRTRFDPKRLLQCCEPYPVGQMEAYPVNPRVGNVRYDTPDLIEEFVPPIA